MISINRGSVPAEFPQKRDGIVDCGAQGPMSQQDAVGCHGHEMYPQKFVQLVGCRDPNAESMKELIACIKSLRRDRRSADGASHLNELHACVNANLELCLRSPMAKTPAG